MKIRNALIIAAAALLAAGVVPAQDDMRDVEEPGDVLKIAALEALLAAPPERALPLVTKVLDADNTTEVKEAALFVLSQIDLPEARQQLLAMARSGDPELGAEAVRMIGISGDPDALAGLDALYSAGSEEMREAVLEAYLIAGETGAVYDIAANASSAAEFAGAVEILGAMGATEELRSLSAASGYTEELIQALGIAGGDDVNQTLMEIYRSAETDDIRTAALEGMLISGYDQGVLELYRESTDVNEKRELLQMLSIMNSDLMLEIIDSALEGGA
jgi:hypothetical protein